MKKRSIEELGPLEYDDLPEMLERKMKDTEDLEQSMGIIEQLRGCTNVFVCTK
ncbi:MAG: hypothetical protein IPO48_01480 [Saprospiraceae bacterium]|nr:hypothetical protein [Saprospiraceae bacterium]